MSTPGSKTCPMSKQVVGSSIRLLAAFFCSRHLMWLAVMSNFRLALLKDGDCAVLNRGEVLSPTIPVHHLQRTETHCEQKVQNKIQLVSKHFLYFFDNFSSFLLFCPDFWSHHHDYICLESENIWFSRVDHNDGQILSTMEWSMVFVKVPLCSMVFQWFLYNWTIAIEWMVLQLTIFIDGMVNGF